MHIRRESAVGGLFRKAAALALLYAFVGGSSAVYAQAVTGSIYGQAGADAKVTIKNDNTGLTREVTAGNDGNFNVSSLPSGNYSVTANGKTFHARVNAGVGTAVQFSDTELEEVVVLGTTASPIDVTTAQVSTTYSADQLNELPVAHDIVNVVLLAPGTTKGDSAFGNLASFGGASVAENAYYVNGFNVTNLFKNLSYAKIPFQAIGSEQVITGSVGPEYGLATGGVVSLQTKKGTNDWTGGVAAYWEPQNMRAHSPQSYRPLVHSLFKDYSLDGQGSSTYDAWVGGPIIQDKLFVFAVAEYTRKTLFETPSTTPVSMDYASGGNSIDLASTRPFGLVNVDWNINDRHSLELTVISNHQTDASGSYASVINGAGIETPNSFNGTSYQEVGGLTQILKYTGAFTDNFSLSAEAGRLRSSRGFHQVAPDGTLISYVGAIDTSPQQGCPVVTYESDYSDPFGVGAPSCWIDTPISAINAEDKRTSSRLDMQYKLDGGGAGMHTLKAGVDIDHWSTFYGEADSGGVSYDYTTAGATDNVPLNTDVVNQVYFRTAANVKVDSTGYYLKDDWQLNPKMLVQVGVRIDSFKNKNGQDQVYAEQTNIVEPRLGFSYDVNGDSKQKLYGSYGLYSLPIAPTAAVRGASESLYSHQDFLYTGVDPVTGAPVLGAPTQPVQYYNNEKPGVVPNPASVSSSTLDPTIQEEIVLGYQRQLTHDWRAGVRFTYRNLKKTTDDWCDIRVLQKAAADLGLTFDSADIGTGCYIINPGYPVNLKIDLDNSGVLQNLNLSPAQVNIQKAIRKYLGVEFTAEKAWSNRWYSQLSYTWAHNYGNAEGLVDSDIHQADTGTTEAFDYNEAMIGSYGNLPNDRRHTFKALGAFKASEEVTLSGDLLIQSGRPKVCLGHNPVDDTLPPEIQYGTYYWYCDGHVASRGSAGNQPTLWNIDLALTYQPSGLQNLKLQLKVFNVMNRAAVTNSYWRSQLINGAPRSYFGSPMSYQEPRFIAVSADYAFGGK